MKTVALCIFACSAIALRAADSRVLDSMDAQTFQVPKEKCTVEVVEGKDGKALKFSFDKECRNIAAISKIRGAADWDAAAGISFWVKGDGSDHLGGMEFIWNEDYGIRYAFAFPISGTEWTKVLVPWSDFVPETSNAKALPLGKEGNAPSKLGTLWFGKWWYWRDYAAHSYTIDDIRLETKLVVPVAEPVKHTTPSLQRVLAKLQAGKPVTIVTMGDSLTDYAHWANKPINWPTLLKEKLHAKYKSEVTIVNPAMGGTELRQNMILIPRWQKEAPEPDLVTIWFGGNDWNSGMRGAMFDATMQDAVERVRAATKDKADVLIMSTCPSVENWDTMAELAEGCRHAAGAKYAAIGDIYKVFHEIGKADPASLYCKDKTHLGAAGHELVAKTIADLIENK